MGADTSLAAIGRPINCVASNELVSLGAAGPRPAEQEVDEGAEAAARLDTQKLSKLQARVRAFCSRLITSILSQATTCSRLVFKGTNRNRNPQISFQLIMIIRGMMWVPRAHTCSHVHSRLLLVSGLVENYMTLA